MTRKRWGELALVAATLVVALGILAAAGGGVLWTRPFWLDEVVSYLLATRASPMQVIHDVAIGGEWNPPLLPLINWTIGRIVGDVTPTLLRSVSLVCVAIALLFVYDTLRRRFSAGACAAATLAVAGHSLVIAQAFEARFYGPWLMFAALFAWTLGLDSVRVSSRRRDVAIAVAAVFLCMIHWFGVISLVLMSAAAVASRRAAWREGLRVVAPAAAGIVAVIAALPWLLSQRASATSQQWVPALSAPQIAGVARVFYLALVPVAAAILLLTTRLREEPPAPFPSDRGIAALASAALMPVVLAVVSILVQPALLDRYAIVATLAWAPLVVIAVEPLTSRGRIAATAILGLVLWVNVSRGIGERRRYAAVIGESASAFAAVRNAGVPLVFQSMHTVYPVAGVDADARSVARFLALSDSTLDAMFGPSTSLREHFRLERDITRSLTRVYGFPVPVTERQLDSVPKFIVVATDLSLPAGYKEAVVWGRKLFPRHRMTRLGPALAVFER